MMQVVLPSFTRTKSTTSTATAATGRFRVAGVMKIAKIASGHSLATERAFESRKAPTNYRKRVATRHCLASVGSLCRFLNDIPATQVTHQDVSRFLGLNRAKRS
jgi:hypothetical protein